MAKSSLTEMQKERVFQLSNDGFSQTKIAKLYGVSQGTIHHAIKDQKHKAEIAEFKNQQTIAMAAGAAAVVSGAVSVNNLIEEK